VRTIAQAQGVIPVVRKAVLPLFLVSGAAGLVYEVTWTRAFGVVFRQYSLRGQYGSNFIYAGFGFWELAVWENRR